jgi:two-component system sensor histidine kinase TctE
MLRHRPAPPPAGDAAAPLVLLALVNAWFDYRSADNVALQQDQRLLRWCRWWPTRSSARARPGGPPVLLLAPAVEEFLKDRPGFRRLEPHRRRRQVLVGEDWLASLPPTGAEPEFHSEEHGGVTWRIVRQRQQTVSARSWWPSPTAPTRASSGRAPSCSRCCCPTWC